MTSADQELRVKDRLVTLNDVVNRHRVHVVNQDLVVDVMICYAKIATIVSGNDVVSNLTPLLRSIEPLIDMSVKPKRRRPHRAGKS